ncbi:DUF6856 family protein [[Mycoplasma] cavipharyngis]|uniref:DUF6856 family protein n=1 Tax=[Mycoplasma] cavipharyngis TaxID=92757 RepID=UPI0037049927
MKNLIKKNKKTQPLLSKQNKKLNAITEVKVDLSSSRKSFAPFTKVNKVKLSKGLFAKILLSLIGFSAFAFVPLATLTVSDNDPYNTSLFREISSKDIDNETEYAKLPLVPVSYGELIRGTTRYNDGNYVLYLGTGACSHCTEFLFDEAKYAKNGVPPLGKSESNARWSRGIWGKGIKYASTNLTPNKINYLKSSIKFVMFEDEPPSSIQSYSDRLYTFPWKKEEANNLKNGIIAGQYVRYDQSAHNFRKIFAYAKSIHSEIIGTPTVMAFRAGKFYWYDFNKSAPTPAPAKTDDKDKNKDNNEKKNNTTEVTSSGSYTSFATFLNSTYQTLF